MKIYQKTSLLISLVLLVACGSKLEESQSSNSQIKALDISVVDLAERHYLVIRDRLPLAIMTGFLGLESKNLVAAARQAGIEPLGPIAALFYDWDEAAGIGEAAVALPVAAGTSLAPYQLISLPSCKAFAATLQGDYTGLGAIHYGLNTQFQAQKTLQPMAPSIEEYIKGPTDGVAESDFVTRVLYPIEPN